MDGSHIETLILTFFFRHMKDLIENGYVYIATPPLYQVKKGQRSIYAWNDDERDRLPSSKARVEAKVASTSSATRVWVR